MDKTNGATGYNFIVDNKVSGIRLDKYLAQNIGGISRSYIQKLLETDAVKINGNVCNAKKYKVNEGDSIEIIMPELKELEVEPENINLDIVYEDEDVLVVNKPKGMVVHPAAGNYTGTLVNAVMYHCKDRLSSINGVIRPGIVHRIDKDTSGLLMIAKNNFAHEILSEQLAEHSVNRVYTALVYDNIKRDEGVVDTYIGRDANNRLRRAVVDGQAPDAKRAVTHYKVIERFGGYTLINAKLETGRTHQIRVHMAYINHPLLGDLVYGPKKTRWKIEGQLLHAGTLGFVHPTRKEYMEFEVPIPDEFENILNKIRKGNL